MNEIELKACDQCMHHSSVYSGFFIFHFCDKYVNTEFNYINGEIIETPKLCSFARADEKLCGTEAIGYEHRGPEVKEAKEKRGAWWHLKNFFRIMF